jgi:hypothetical protein
MPCSVVATHVVPQRHVCVAAVLGNGEHELVVVAKRRPEPLRGEVDDILCQGSCKSHLRNGPEDLEEGQLNLPELVLSLT